MRLFHSKTTLLFLLLFLATSRFASAQDTSSAFTTLEKLLPLVCGEFMDSGSSKQLSISGNAEAQVDGFLKELVDMGFEGAAEINTREYVGVLREEVGDQLKSVRDCKSRIYNDFKVVIIQEVAGPRSQVINSISNSGDNTTNIIGDGNSVNAK